MIIRGKSIHTLNLVRLQDSISENFKYEGADFELKGRPYIEDEDTAEFPFTNNTSLEFDGWCVASELFTEETTFLYMKIGHENLENYKTRWFIESAFFETYDATFNLHFEESTFDYLCDQEDERENIDYIIELLEAVRSAAGEKMDAFVDAGLYIDKDGLHVNIK